MTGELVTNEIALLNRMEMDPAGVAADLGGKPFAIICPKGRRTRYKRLADWLGLQIFENSEMVKREDGFVLIHAGEVSKWLPNFKP